MIYRVVNDTITDLMFDLFSAGLFFFSSSNGTVVLLMIIWLLTLMGRRRLPDVFTFTSASIKSSVEFHKRICRAGEKTNVSDSLSKKLKNKTCDGGFHILVFG